MQSDRKLADDGRPRGGFTLIELLVVISVIALLIAILLPALGQARKTGAQTRESAAARQITMAYLTYTNDHKGQLLPGYLKTSWTFPSRDPRHYAPVYDNPSASEEGRMEGLVVQRYPWRLIPYLDFSLQALVVDKHLFGDLRSLPDNRAGKEGYQYAFSYNPSFGLNTTYVGGDSQRGAYYAGAVLRYGRFYITNVDQPEHPERLMVFTTARGIKANTQDELVPGKHRVEGPWQATHAVQRVPQFVQWPAPPGPFNPALSPETYGHVDFRNFNRAIVSTFDGHVASHTLDEMKDMRRWSNQATSASWHP